MNKNPEVLALIPARGNSKTISHKNIREFAGYPLITFSIAAARQALSVTRTIVSTDDEKIAAIAREYGAETPFMRPAEFSCDNTLDLPVFQHALRWLEENENYRPDMVVQLRPTSPIRPAGMVDAAVELLAGNPKADSVRGVVPAAQNPYKMWRINEQEELIPILELESLTEPYNAPRQDLPLTYWQTGHIDVIRQKTILEKDSMSGNIILPLLIDPAYTVDIDTVLDWQRAERCVQEGVIDLVFPGRERRKFPEAVKLLVFDFDGVFTDDRVYVDENGKEMVAANRADGLGLELLRKYTDIELVVISKETNPVVTARCKKLDIPVIQSVNEKDELLLSLIKEKSINPEEVIFVGNDVNDLVCFPIVGFAAAPSNAVALVKQHADLILEKPGGYGAVREITEKLTNRYSKTRNRA